MPQLDSFVSSQFAVLSDKVRRAIEQAPLPDLDGGPSVPELVQLLGEIDEEDFGGISAQQRALCESGLWLLAGQLDRSHTISQDIGSAEGSFWHGIMHRREGDFGNSKYWFRKVGDHPVLRQLPEVSGGDYDDPFDFVDACSRAVRGDADASDKCRTAQWQEWQALMAHCLGPSSLSAPRSRRSFST